MKKLRYISIHQPWPFQLLFLPFSLEQSFFPLDISVLNFSRSMRLHSPVVTMLRFIKFPFWRQQNYWSMLSPLWSKAECVCGCECAPSSIVASFKLEAFLTRTGDLARQNNQPHHMRNTRSRTDIHTCSRPTSKGSHTHSRLWLYFVGSATDHPGDWIHP